MLYPSIPEESVDSLYLKWGGIPRYVLKYALADEQQAFLNNIDSVIESFGASDAKADASSRFIHRSVREDFHSGPY